MLRESSPATGSEPKSRTATADLLARYDIAAPRYTSYPTAVEFGEDFDARQYEERLRSANRLRDVPLSVYVHLPFCLERCLFCGCHVIITPHKEKARPYLDLLELEMELLAERLPDRRRLSQLHLGGGTPTYYEPAELGKLVRALFSRFRPDPEAELAVEVDPRVTTEAHIDALADLGFNRISLGVQDFTPAVQEAIHRIQSVEQTARIVERARSRGFSGINIDLIYGLPLQTPETFERTVDEVISLGADRSAVYSFAYVPWLKAQQKRLPADALPSRDVKFSLFALARERFLAAGYEPIGMDHFARPDDELSRAKREGRLKRNFQGYSVLENEDVLGLGISAIGDVGGAYVQNEKKLSRYESALVAHRLPVERGRARTFDDEIRRSLIHGLMCNSRVDIPALERRYEISFADYFADDLRELAPYAEEGLVEIRENSLEATATGQLLIRNLALCFDPYWREKHRQSERPTFSRTI